MEPRTPSDSQSSLVRWMGVTDANGAGNVHGGSVMRYCDEAAGLAGTRHSRSRVVTAAMDRMTFLEPIAVGEVLTFRARVNAAWRTSVEVGVRVEAVPPLQCESETEHRREREAQLRRANRLAEREEILRARGGPA